MWGYLGATAGLSSNRHVDTPGKGPIGSTGGRHSRTRPRREEGDMGDPRTISDALSRSESHLDAMTRGDEHSTLERWQSRCPELAFAPISSPAEMKGWLRHQSPLVAGAVLRCLTCEAQAGDQAALLMLVCCLSPGIRALASRTRISVDEAVSELVVGI